MSTTSLDNPAIAAAMQMAYYAIRKGNLQKADLLCRQALAQDSNLGVAWQLLAVIAHRVGANDLALQESLKRLKGLKDRPNENESRKLVSHWSPWRSVGALFLWKYYRGAPDERDE